MTSTRRPFEKLADPPEDLAAAERARYEAGETTQRQVAEAFGCSLNWARDFMKRLAWAKPSRRRAAAKPAPAKTPARKPATRKKKKPAAPKRAVRAATAAAASPVESVVEHGDILLRLAGRALRLMDKLETKLDAEDLSDEHMRLMTGLVKMLADFRKSGIASGGSADANDNAADAADSAADLARARSDLVARIDAAIAARDVAGDSGGD